MAIWDSARVDVIKFNETWNDPFDEKFGLMSAEVYAQLCRALNHFEEQIGVDILSSVYYATPPNRYTRIFSMGTFPTDETFKTINPDLLPQGQYINAHKELLFTIGDKINKLAGGWTGFKFTDDKIWYFTSDGTPHLGQIYREIWESNGLTQNPTATVPSSPLDLRHNWGRIIKTYQELFDSIKYKRSIEFYSRPAKVEIEYVEGSSKFEEENFDLIQRTDHLREYMDVSGFFGENPSVPWTGQDRSFWVFGEKSVDHENNKYDWMGNTGFNECPSHQTQWDSESIFSAPRLALNRMFRTAPHLDSGGVGVVWANSNFHFNAEKGRPNHVYEPIFGNLYFYRYYYSDPNPPDNCEAVHYYQNWLHQTYPASIGNFGWSKLGGTKKTFKFRVVMPSLAPPFTARNAEITTFAFENPFTISVTGKWGHYPEHYPHEKGGSGSTTIYNNFSSMNVEFFARSTGDANLDQSILPLPGWIIDGKYTQRTYGGYVRFENFDVVIDGIPTAWRQFETKISPRNKFYFDRNSITY